MAGMEKQPVQFCAIAVQVISVRGEVQNVKQRKIDEQTGSILPYEDSLIDKP